MERDSREIKTSASLWQRGGPPTDRRPPVGLARRGALTAPYATNSNGQGVQVMNCECTQSKPRVRGALRTKRRENCARAKTISCCAPREQDR